MKVEFSKYHGTGNDFIIINNFDKKLNHNSKLANILCDRHFGIGSDGLIIIEKHEKYDFSMIFYNPDGNQSFCGNGSRCAVKFAFDNNLTNKHEPTFLSTDGLHKGIITKNNIEIEMKEPEFLTMTPIKYKDFIIHSEFLNTGSPHVVLFLKNEETFINTNVKEYGSEIRNSKEFKSKGGVNVNFVYNIENSKILMRTFERGVEDETLSCGTGITASAIIHHKLFLNELKNNNIEIVTFGGKLNVKFDFIKNKYKNIWLCGPAKFIFSGKIDIRQ